VHAFPSCTRSILAGILPMPRLFLSRNIEDGNGRAGLGSQRKKVGRKQAAEAAARQASWQAEREAKLEQARTRRYQPPPRRAGACVRVY
jgi:hypothetical protein